ncbi:hypothetical protein MTQ10_11605 [Streptomyces sp. XM83C]|jgi:hypothetical protein|uniref:Secreted protein n=1 Tax=Streptomyces thermocoprophilus TaxID=78356 RepID=A0ABV5VB67_9ACTN|nr:hypothetical protein [Streptomyces sp. XM83C]MCK1820246.1 hypothetical protein [Streptomyces sp. XM83C]
MNDDVRNIVLGVIVAGISAALGWLARTALWRRRLRRRQAFFGLPDNSESLLVVNRGAGGPDLSVMRYDVFALLELAALIKDCNAYAQVVPHDMARQGFGERTEFCVGGPASNRRMAAHLSSLLPGVRVNVDSEPSPDRGAFQIGSEVYRVEPGKAEYVLLARLTVDQSHGTRPVFLFCGQTAITNQAATRYLARHHERLRRKHGNGSFVLLLKVVNSQAYGPDVVEQVADVTRAAQAPLPVPAPTSHRASS